MRRQLLPALAAILLLGCGPAPDASALRLVTIESAEADLSLRELPPEALRSVGLPFGLAVVRAGSLAERAGLKIGDVVYGVNRKTVETLEEFNRMLAERDYGRLVLTVRRGRTDFYVSIDLARDAPAKGTLLRT